MSKEEKMPPARKQMTDEQRAVQRREHAAGIRTAHSRMNNEQWAVQRRENAAGMRV